MCAILDNNVVHQVFGHHCPEAGKEFFKWINSGSGKLVVGGKLSKELAYSRFRNWFGEAIKSGRAKRFNDQEINNRTTKLTAEGVCKSDDQHIIALAQISHARLLYSNDHDLQQDFRNKKLIDKPRGKVYSTNVHQSFEDTHRKLLEMKNLCRSDDQID